MPKEYINNHYYGQYALDHHDCPHSHSPEGCAGGTDCRAERVALDDSAMKVGWTKDREHVEMAIVRFRDGAAPVDADAWHTQFDRAGINRLIRVLRQARDDAFGKDA